MDRKTVYQISEQLWRDTLGNILVEEMGIRREHIGKRLYDPPLVGFGSADDPLFDAFKKPDVVGPWHMSPKEWLPDARTVISFFFPTSKEVR